MPDGKKLMMAGGIWRNFAILAALAGLFAVAGCSTPQSRAKERAVAFERLSEEDQKLVMAGRIREGLSEDAVYVALGRPTRVARGRVEGKDEVKWIYSRMETRTVPTYRTRVVRTTARGAVVVYDDYVPYTDAYLVDAFEVVFRGGKVVGWREL